MPAHRRSASPRGDGSARDVRRDEFTKVTDALKAVNVTREEFEQATNHIHNTEHQLEVQFQRISQIQADLDAIKLTLKKLTNR